MIVIADQLRIDKDVFETWPCKLCQRCVCQSASNFAPYHHDLQKVEQNNVKCTHRHAFDTKLFGSVVNPVEDAQSLRQVLGEVVGDFGLLAVPLIQFCVVWLSFSSHARVTAVERGAALQPQVRLASTSAGVQRPQGCCNPRCPPAYPIGTPQAAPSTRSARPLDLALRVFQNTDSPARFKLASNEQTLVFAQATAPLSCPLSDHMLFGRNATFSCRNRPYGWTQIEVGLDAAISTMPAMSSDSPNLRMALH